MSPHIVVAKFADHLTVSVRDYELFDFVDDQFLAAGMSYEYLQEEKTQEATTYTMHFLASVSSESLDAVLSKISETEIIRILGKNKK